MYKAFELEIESKRDIDFISVIPNGINNYREQINDVRQSFIKNIQKNIQLKDEREVVDVRNYGFLKKSMIVSFLIHIKMWILLIILLVG
ncbi:hypothetical protein [Limosilactobacillus caviae]|uniref:hypothetical protein n=1 Tax=Limosilactobacillus caviae TaxID=1769424 RepID=UPI003516AA9F